MKLGKAPCAAVMPTILTLGTCSFSTVVNAVTWRLVQALTMVLRNALVGIGLTCNLLGNLLVVFLI